MKEINLEEAKKIIEDYPDVEHYIQEHFSQFMNYGEADDNSIELANYWGRCKKIVDDENEPPESDLICPFCSDDNFDKIGLKYHLRNHCEEYDKVPNP